MTPRRTPPPPAPELYRFNALDFTAIGLYLAVAAFFTLAGALILPLLLELAPTPAAASYGVNLIFYGLVGTVALLAARKVVSRDLKVLATRPWFTLLMVPAAVIAMMILTAVVVAASGEAQTSANQEGLQDLVQQVPAWLMIPLLVVVGPFVEEYIFRHLLIGKLSRRVNVWVCSIISVVLFAAMHIVGQEDLTLPALLPYLAMGATLVLVYLWTGRNLMFSYFVHAAKNLLAAVMLYAISPEVLEQLQQVQP
ncbi:type II CAAX endopeptidase family protein [Pseudarthrobacter sp. J75]|uniref:CPBP family intramembrane glutamic endopeptidase n=1 Tax=unclassified Pseudarthrobacter TaxID=2647000 RepID=UPI002E7FC1FC|nr:MULTISPECIES: type II CAAX endopeptidase family protein [unclassified Pseudarthrobacter]MEE2522185.1 type II CAAX endopeptidase family protein [Pseudarthrobacter sp. J47]MEE2528169.1 type II CAAX endopeptidase family protein [Pseudarthrobacter sp. J75]MEE2567872.1 type II CAAX endopeptidase family protein [Pseudarthrobacter sp. J64]